MREDVCEVKSFHPEHIETVQKVLPTYDTEALSQLFKVLSDARRLKILYALTIEAKLCVCDIAVIIDASIATTSHHLRKLSKLGILTHEKIGKMVYYQLEEPIMRHLLLDVLQQQTGGKLHDAN